MGRMSFLKRLFDRKVLDKTIVGYNVEKIKEWLGNVEKIDSFKYYYIPSRARVTSPSRTLKNHPTDKILSILETHFYDSSTSFTEIQRKVYKSGKQQIILRGKSTRGEIEKIAVLELKPYQEK